MTDMPRVVQASGGTVDRSHHNNFDAIRIAAAFAVLYSHQFALTGRPEPSFFGLHSWGGFAVIVFFVVSGFLVTSSWYNDPNVLRFSARRILRLWPALTVVTVLTAYGLGAWVTSLPLHEYWSSRATLDYLNILRMRIYYVLPGVFEHNPYAMGVNGSLWTIPLEVRCYVVLALAGLLRLMRWRSVWLACIALYMAWFITKSSADLTGHVHYGRELSAFFLAGSALFLLREHWEHRPLTWLLALGATAAVLWAFGWRFTATLVFIPLAVIYAGTRSTPVIRRFGRLGDPSYGAYLIAFPVQQTVIHYLYPRFNFITTLLTATALTFVLAYASWHAIEKTALRLKPRRRPPAQPGGNGPAERPFKASHVGLPLALLSCALAIAGQSYYAIQAHTSLIELSAGMLPMAGAAQLLCITLIVLAGTRSRWLRHALRLSLVAVMLVTAVTTLIAAIGFWQTGAIPRTQQLHGLTWDIVGPSILAIARDHAIALLLGLISLVATLWGLPRLYLRTGVHRVKVRPMRAALLGIVFLATGLGAAQLGTSRGVAFIATQLFYSDLDAAQALSEHAQEAEVRFFETYRRDLAATDGSRRYPEMPDRLRGDNVIWLVLESVRAKDVPLYGGQAHMPNFTQARKHMILLNHLYVQDPRSTKSYAQMDLGRFGLLSWDTYSNNLPWLLPKDGLAAHLDQLGYATAALANSDANYDNNQLFQKLHGYQRTMYRQAINVGSSHADDLKLLEQARRMVGEFHSPFYMMLWPIQTHHPYGREYWSHEWTKDAGKTEGQDMSLSDHTRYMKALNEADDWFGRLIAMLKAQGVYENTTIIVTGDHGEAFREHEPGNNFHGNGVYEESVHVPGFIYSPKINGLHQDERYLRLLDLPATILDIAADGNGLFNDGRSIFRNYKHDMPIFLFNSWAGAVGIIHDGHKLWRRTKFPKEVFFASMRDIQRDPDKEREPLKPGDGAPQLHMLDDWETAMMARSARLLNQTGSEQPLLNDIVRVYCDDGHGFREELKGYSAFTGLSDQVTIAVKSNCRALRIAPIKDTPVSQDAYLKLDITDLRVLGDDKSWALSDMALASSNAMDRITPDEFRITSGSPFIDYHLDTHNHRIQEVSMNLTFAWVRPSAGSKP